MLKLTAPASMNADQQALWLASAVEALEGIRAAEVSAVSMEIKRSISHHQKIVPEIARLVSEKRQRASRPQASQPMRREYEIDQESAKRRGAARGREELNAAWEWERQARIDAGLPVKARPAPFSRDELDNMLPHIRQMGLNAGFLEYRDGRLVEA